MHCGKSCLKRPVPVNFNLLTELQVRSLKPTIFSLLSDLQVSDQPPTLIHKNLADVTSVACVLVLPCIYTDTLRNAYNFMCLSHTCLYFPSCGYYHWKIIQQKLWRLIKWRILQTINTARQEFDNIYPPSPSTLWRVAHLGQIRDAIIMTFLSEKLISITWIKITTCFESWHKIWQRSRTKCYLTI